MRHSSTSFLLLVLSAVLFASCALSRLPQALFSSPRAHSSSEAHRGSAETPAAASTVAASAAPSPVVLSADQAAQAAAADASRAEGTLADAPATPAQAAAADSLKKADAMTPEMERAALQRLDSIVKRTQRDTIISLRGSKADTLHRDTLRLKKSGIEAPVIYTAKDSLIYDMQTGSASLFGEAKVDYQNMNLTAARIVMNMDSSLVHAVGQRDSLTAPWEGKPVYRQGAEQYESEGMSFNFKSKKGYITNVVTKQGNGYMHSTHSKRSDDGYMYLENARYTTCDHEHPHFYLQLTRAKVAPGKETFFGPAYLVVADVPLPIAVPFGFFPFTTKYSSGIIMPTYGDETSRGFYLREGGYYFALSDRMDLKLLGEIYTKGSWGLSAESNYARRYRYRGNFYISRLTTILGEKNMPDYSKATDLKVQWTHSTDAKAMPNTTFSARVNFASQGYERSNLTSIYTPLSYTQSTRSSAVSFSHNIPSIGLSIAASANLSQNMRDSSVAVSLPELSLSLNRFYPFRRKRQVGNERWYEKISLSYTGSMTNSITTKEDLLFRSNLLRDWRNGMQHRIPIDATFQLFKHLNISPSIQLNDRTYFTRIRRSWDVAAQREREDTTYGFYNLYDWSTSLSVNTTLYGFYKPWRKLFGTKISAIRHVFKPSIGFSYSPDFTTESYGYTRHYVRTDAAGNVSTVSYSPYAYGTYGYPRGTTSGSLSMNVSNNLEMKVRSERDSTGYRKISLIDELGASMSYNFAARERQWSDLNLRLRLKFTKSYTFSMAATFATYAYEIDDKGQVYVGTRTEYSYGRFGRFQGMSQNLSYTLNNRKMMTFFNLLAGRGWDKLFGAKRDEEAPPKANDETEQQDDEANLDPMLRKPKQAEKQQKAAVSEDGYLAFSMPWSLTLSYGISMNEDRSKAIRRATMRYPWAFTQTLNFSGNIALSKGWNISFTSGYDFNYKELSMTTASLSRKLHDFTLSCNIVLRPYSSFNFSIRADAAELADVLRYEKRSAYSSNIDWY